jgi:DegV family protein with EDD domain
MKDNPIRIVTDSTADIPRQLSKAYNIHVVPNIVVIEGQSLEDEVSISRKEFYERLPSLREIPTTGTASSGVYETLYQKLFQEGAAHILSVHPSTMLSGIVNAANAAAQAFPGRVHVIDSETISMGLGFQVLAAAEEVKKNTSLDQVLVFLKDLPKRVKVIAMLDTLEYIRRSGRVSWARASLGNLLSIKLFVEVKSGKVERMGEVRTRRKAIARLIDLIQRTEGIERMAILHTNSEADAKEIQEAVTGITPEPSLLVNVTTVIGSHVGPNCLGYAVVCR